MNNALAITLVITGTLIVLAPPISDHLHRAQVAQIIAARPEVTNVNLDGKMDDDYRWACWALGAALIFITLGKTLRSKKPGGGS